MKVKSKKIIAVVIMCIFLIELCTVSYAGFLDGVRGESGYSPPPPTPSDSPQTTPPSSSTTPSEPSDGVTRRTRPYYNKISGTVTEDIGYTSAGAGNDDVKNGKPIAGVKVSLGSASTVTGEDGTFELSPSPGTYDLVFDYGDVSGIDQNDIASMKNVLKYNGHDYIAVSVEGSKYSTEYIDIDKEEVIQSGKGALQFFIALDCSYSMRYTNVEYNGETRSRLDVAVEAAKELCQTLVDSGDNIYIGLVFFSGTNYRAVSLTKDLNLLNSALDDINTNDWYTANTNIVGALDKVYNSYYNNTEDSNRYVAIISDGVPTSDGNTETYTDDSDATIYSKLDTISETTAAKLDELLGNGVKVISLITKSEDPTEDQYVQKIFNGDHSTIFENIEDGYKTVDVIQDALKDYLIEHTEEKHYSSSSTTILRGHEDEARREEVDGIFADNNNILNYDNTIMFDQIENYSPDTYDEAKKLSDSTNMTVYGGTYTIESEPTPNPKRTYETDPETGEQKLVEEITYVPASYSASLVLAQRPGFSLATKITATGLRVILGNGQQLGAQTVEPGSDFPVIQTLDKELAQGATLQIEYTISIKNDSSIQCDYLELINYLPTKFVYDPNIDLITAEGTNAEVGWESVSLEDLLAQNLVTQETVDKFSLNSALKLTLDNAGQGENGFYIAPGGEYTIRYVVSRMIGSLNDIDNPDFGIASEVLAYKNQANRRMTYTVGAQVAHQLAGAYPGDSQDMDYSDESTNEVIVIPPTGKERDYKDILISFVLKYIIGIVTNI